MMAEERRMSYGIVPGESILLLQSVIETTRM